MPLYVGLDCSTQSLTAIVIAVDGDRRRVVFQHALSFDCDFPAYRTTNGVWRGDDPREVSAPPTLWVEALDRMMAIVAAAPDVNVSRIRAVSGSAQQHGSVYLTRRAIATWRDLDPTQSLAAQLGSTFSRSDSPVWMDESTGPQCEAIQEALGGADAMMALTGSRAYERFTGPQIRKFAEQRPAEFAATARIHLVSSFLASLLSGSDAPIDVADGSGMNLMDLTTGHWSTAALEATAPRLDQRLPRLVPSCTMIGTLSPYWQARYGWPPAAVVAWSGDNPSSLVGTGVVREGSLGVSLGTSDTVFARTRKPQRGVSHVFASPTGDYMSLVCFRNGSLARERIRDAYGLDWDGFSRALDLTPAGNGGALMLPWFEPEITPHVPAPGLRRFNLDEHDGACNVRAVVEAQMMAMANHAAAPGAQPVNRIIATGGASTNRALLQIMANVFGSTVYSLDVGNSACLGAALRALHADRRAQGDPVSWEEAVAGFTEPREANRVEPVPVHVGVYSDLKKRYAVVEEEHLRHR